MASVTAQPALGGRKLKRLEIENIPPTVLLCVVGFLVLYPVLQVCIQSVLVSSPGEAAQFGLDGWASLFTEQGMRRAILNTVGLSVAREVIALPLAILLAWLVARTDLPGRHFFEFAFWISFFLPTLTVVLSWILLLDPEYGLINQLLTKIGLPAFSIYSFWGIVWAHTIAHGVSFKVMLFAPIFRNLDASFEEASQISGASVLGTLRRIVVPLMIPAILAVEFLSFIRSLETFEIERILGTPNGFFVISTMIYDEVRQSEPHYAPAAALGVAMLVVMISLIAWQRRIVGRRSFTTITGQYHTQTTRLGKWGRPAAIGVGVVVFLVVAVPLVASIMGTFMKLFGFFTIPDPWTLNNWNTALRDRLFMRSLQNTLILAFGTAVVGMLVHSFTAYVIIRTRFYGKGALDVLSWLPYTIPGILLSLALLSMFLQPAFRVLYGSLASLIIAGLIGGMPLSVQIMKANLMQLGKELEEASWVTGGGWFRTYTRVVLPLMTPSLVVIGLITFIGAARNISQVALLTAGSNRPLSMMQLDYITEGKFEIAAVISCCVLILTLGVALMARSLGYRVRAG